MRTCGHCRREFEGRRDADHCGDRCRARALRERNKEVDRSVRRLLEEALGKLAGKGKDSP